MRDRGVVGYDTFSGGVYIQSEDHKKAEVLPEGFYVLYYDPETPGWMIDSQPGLQWNKETENWEVDNGAHEVSEHAIPPLDWDF